jgi:RsiW-degrading membrane proteinase PrsW (M82 family)
MENQGEAKMEKIEETLTQIRADIAKLQYDITDEGSGINFRIFLILFLLLAIAIHDLFNVGGEKSIGISFLLIGLYTMIYFALISYKLEKKEKKLMELKQDKNVELT